MITLRYALIDSVTGGHFLDLPCESTEHPERGNLTLRSTSKSYSTKCIKIRIVVGLKIQIKHENREVQCHAGNKIAKKG